MPQLPDVIERTGLSRGGVPGTATTAEGVGQAGRGVAYALTRAASGIRQRDEFEQRQESEQRAKFDLYKAHTTRIGRVNEIFRELDEWQPDQQNPQDWGDQLATEFQTRHERAVGEIAETIHDPVALESFLADSQRTALEGYQNAWVQGQNKQRVARRADMQEAVASNINLAVDGNETVWRDAITNIRGILEGGVAHELITEDQRMDAERAAIYRVVRDGLQRMEPAERLRHLDRPVVRVLDEFDQSLRAEMKRTAQNEIDAGVDRANRVALSKLQDRTKDYQAAVMTGREFKDPPTEEQYVALLGEEDGKTAYSVNVASIEADAQLSREASQWSLEDRVTWVMENSPAGDDLPPAGEGFAQEVDEYSRRVKMLSNIQKQIEADPVMFIQEQHEDKPATPENADFYLAEQSRHGVLDPKLLTKNGAAGVVAMFKDPDAESTASMIHGLAREWGDHWPTVYRQISKAGLPDAAMVIGSGRVSEDVAAQLSNIAHVPAKELSGALPNDSVTKIKDGLTGSLEDLRVTFSFQGSSGASAFNMMARQAEKLAYSLATQGVAPEEAVERANAALSSGYELFSTYRVPYEYEAGGQTIAIDPDEIEDGADWMLDQIKGQDLLAPENTAGVSDEEMVRTMDEVLDDAFWVTSDNEDGLVLVAPTNVGPRQMYWRDGEPIRMTWESLRGAEAQGWSTGRRGRIQR